jgi:hypothetical protein
MESEGKIFGMQKEAALSESSGQTTDKSEVGYKHIIITLIVSAAVLLFFWGYIQYHNKARLIRNDPVKMAPEKKKKNTAVTRPVEKREVSTRIIKS